MLLAGLAAALLVAPAMARPRAATPQDEPTPQDEMVISHGSVAIDGRPRSYTVHTGTLPILDDISGAPVAHMFVVAYTLDRPAGSAPRPLTFVWNGGPGASSGETQLLGFAPKGFAAPAAFPDWTSPPARIVDRPETLLASSDLVFVDPVGTGYSRASSEAARGPLYTGHGDAEAVAELIRVYRTRFDAFDAPLFIAGESYGTTRAMLVADALTRRRTPLAGVILISGEYDVGQKTPPALEHALQLPMFTATAHWHRKLPADLQALPRDEAVRRAEAWARSDYAGLLARADSLPPAERAAAVAQISRFSAVDARFIDARTLVLTKETDLDRLLDAEGRELGRYDSRMAAPQRPRGSAWWPTADPSIVPVIDIMQGTSPAMIRYFRQTLGYRSDLLYHGPFGEGFHPAPLTYVAPGGPSDDWTTLSWDRGAAGPAAGAEPPLRRALLRAPTLRVLNVTGLYDGSCAAKDEAVRRSEPRISARVRNLCYPSGHAFYTDAAVRRAFRDDFARFVGRAGD